MSERLTDKFLAGHLKVCEMTGNGNTITSRLIRQYQADDLAAKADIANLMASVTRLEADLAATTAERDALRAALTEAERKLGGGCDANEGGDHLVITQGKYQFCGKCGESLRGVRFVHMPATR